jgi:hypothetical protein
MSAADPNGLGGPEISHCGDLPTRTLYFKKMDRLPIASGFNATQNNSNLSQRT